MNIIYYTLIVLIVLIIGIVLFRQFISKNREKFTENEIQDTDLEDNEEDSKHKRDIFYNRFSHHRLLRQRSNIGYGF